MAGVGGYQAPAHPAPVSGMGANSARTDGGPADRQPLRHLPDAQYGEDKTFVAQQRGAPLAAVASPSAPAASPQSGAEPSALVPMGAPSQRPDEPVTHGAALGAGAGTDALNLPNPIEQAQQSALQFIQQAAATSGDPMLQYLAGATQSRF